MPEGATHEDVRTALLDVYMILKNRNNWLPPIVGGRRCNALMLAHHILTEDANDALHTLTSVEEYVNNLCDELQHKYL
jgi:hypothetical protein